MTLIVAATSTNTTPADGALIVLFALFVTVGYGLACWLIPFTHCHRCAGRGSSRRRLSDRLRYGKAPRPRAARGAPDCPHCRGTGLRLRIGRRIANYLNHTRRRGQ